MDIKSMLPAEKKPLSPTLKSTLQSDGFRVENVIFRSRPRYPVTANLYIPDGAEKSPAVLFLCGTVPAGKADAVIQKEIRGLVACGFVVLAVDCAGQGERGLFEDVAGSEGISGYPEKEIGIISRQMKLVGESFEAWGVWDAVRSIDFLESRSEVDPRRIFVTEGQGGDICSRLSMVDDRPALVADSGLHADEVLQGFCRVAGVDPVMKNHDTPLFSFSELQCTPYGMISRLDGQIMLFDFMRAEADEYRVMRPELSREELQEKLRSILDIENEDVTVENHPAVDKNSPVVINVRLGDERQEPTVEGDGNCLNVEVDDCRNGTGKLLGIIDDLAGYGVRRIDMKARGYASVIVLFAALLSEKIEHVTLKDLPDSFDSMLRKRIISVPDSVVPFGILKFTDIPELAGAVGANVIK